MKHSLTPGTVPSDFKTAIVKPLLKKSPECIELLPPISNLSFLSIILEKIVLRQLLAHIDTHNLLSVHQSAYREGHGTETVLLCIVNNILCSVDKNKFSVLLLLDLTAAFDTICHEFKNSTAI